MPRSLLQQKSINQQSITPGTEVGVLDFSVNSASVDGKYEDGSIVLRTGSSVNPAGAFTGGGTGNKAILGTENLQGKNISEVSSIEYNWLNLTGPGLGTVNAPYWNFIIDFDPLGAHNYKVISILDDGLNPLISASLGTYTLEPDGSYTNLWTSANNILIVNQVPPAPGGVSPSVTVGAGWFENSYSWRAIVTANPQAIFTRAFTNDGGLPAGSMCSSGMLISGGSTNVQKSGKLVRYWLINGVTAY